MGPGRGTVISYATLPSHAGRTRAHPTAPPGVGEARFPRFLSSGRFFAACAIFLPAQTGEVAVPRDHLLMAQLHLMFQLLPESVRGWTSHPDFLSACKVEDDNMPTHEEIYNRVSAAV